MTGYHMCYREKGLRPDRPGVVQWKKPGIKDLGTG